MILRQNFRLSAVVLLTMKPQWFELLQNRHYPRMPRKRLPLQTVLLALSVGGSAWQLAGGPGGWGPASARTAAFFLKLSAALAALTFAGYSGSKGTRGADAPTIFCENCNAASVHSGIRRVGKGRLGVFGIPMLRRTRSVSRRSDRRC